jgi:hypothetical protein
MFWRSGYRERDQRGATDPSLACVPALISSRLEFAQNRQK